MKSWKFCFLALSLIFLLTVVSPIANGQVLKAGYVRGQVSTGDGTWSPQNFGWFYYDLDEGLGSESLSVDVEDRRAEEGHIIYRSDVFSSEFEYGYWGNYDSIAFLGKLYLVGYPESPFTEEISPMNNGELREILLDTDETKTINLTKPLFLKDGYQLAVDEISESGDEVNVILLKNGAILDIKVVNTGDTYIFKRDNVPVILVHIDRAMTGKDSGKVDADGIFQASDAPVIKLVEGERLGNMKLTTLSEKGIEFRTYLDHNLTRNNVLPLIGPKLSLGVLDTPFLQYSPVGVIFEHGVHEIRGPVYDESTNLPMGAVGNVKARYDSSNFTGFFFDPVDMLGAESLVIFNITDREITPYRSRFENRIRAGTSGLQYVSYVQSKDFEFDPWGSYRVIRPFGWQQEFFAGYSDGTSYEIDHINPLLEGQIILPILMDSDEDIILGSGGSLSLSEGYDITLQSVSEDKAFINLRKNGEIVNNSVLIPKTTYTYEKDVDEIKDLPIIAVHVQNVFESDPKSGMSGMAIDGIFQISDKDYLHVNSGRDFGKLTIVASTPDFMQMANQDNISLGRGSSQELWPNMYIRVADNDTLRYYLYDKQYVLPSPVLVGINYLKSIPSSTKANFTMAIQAAEIRKVSADIIDPEGRTVFVRNLTENGRGSGDNLTYEWNWNATILRLSDDGSTLLDANQTVPALLYFNESSKPANVQVLFDQIGRIASIQDDETKKSYYLSSYGFSLVNSNLSYEDLLANETARREYIEIEPERSILKFFDIYDGTARLNANNHTITGPLESIEPHIVRIGANPGSYKLRLMIANPVDTLQVSNAFYVQGNEEAQDAVLGLGNATSGENKPEMSKRSRAPGFGFVAAVASVVLMALAWQRRTD